MNTGQAYLETHKRLITKPNQILVPLPLYIDGAVTGQYDKLQVEAMTMSIGILNRKARDKEYAWRPLGYVPNYAKEESRGKRIFVESGHMAAFDMYADLSDEEGEDAGVEEDIDKAADYHAILEVIMHSLNVLIDEGMEFDLHYKGQLYKKCELVFFVPFVKCDGDEGDKLCLSYRSRGKGVKQLCRYCQCPNEDTDNHKKTYPYKTETLLKKLYESGKQEQLRKMSQIVAKNAFHGMRFGLHNDRGIHGACPWELLHAVLLGIFKYCRDCFFEQLGKTSKATEELNSLAKEIGKLMARQSNRNKPRTKFAKGIYKGKLMAKEFTGVLLIMSALLRTTAGSDILRKAYKKNFRQEYQRKDWILLVETLLQWEAYLKKDQMKKSDVHRLKKKHQFLMFLLKTVGNRTTGMGFKTMKFHAIGHLAFDILMFGVPMVVDTGSNESHHKTTKVAAKLTQKDIKNFEKQTSMRLDDLHVLNLAMQELLGRPLWHYYSGYFKDDDFDEDIGDGTNNDDNNADMDVDNQDDDLEEGQTGGMEMNVLWNENAQDSGFRIVSRMKNRDNVEINAGLIDFLWDIQKGVQEFLPKMPIFAEHKRKGVMYRGHPNYRQKGPWYDWAMCRWEQGMYPAQIRCFIDLREMSDEGIEVEGVNIVLAKDVYAVVEVAEIDVETEPLSDIWTPITMDVGKLDKDGDVVQQKFRLVEAEYIMEPLCVIPNIGAKPSCQYLMMKDRDGWADDFLAWIRMDHKFDQMEMTEEPVEPPKKQEDSEEEGSSEGDSDE